MLGIIYRWRQRVSFLGDDTTGLDTCHRKPWGSCRGDVIGRKSLDVMLGKGHNVCLFFYRGTPHFTWPPFTATSTWSWPWSTLTVCTHSTHFRYTIHAGGGQCNRGGWVRPSPSLFWKCFSISRQHFQKQVNLGNLCQFAQLWEEDWITWCQVCSTARSPAAAQQGRRLGAVQQQRWNSSLHAFEEASVGG